MVPNGFVSPLSIILNVLGAIDSETEFVPTFAVGDPGSSLRLPRSNVDCAG
jgi:hypothetical protein